MNTPPSFPSRTLPPYRPPPPAPLTIIQKRANIKSASSQLYSLAPSTNKQDPHHRAPIARMRVAARKIAGPWLCTRTAVLIEQSARRTAICSNPTRRCRNQSTSRPAPRFFSVRTSFFLPYARLREKSLEDGYTAADFMFCLEKNLGRAFPWSSKSAATQRACPPAPMPPTPTTLPLPAPLFLSQIMRWGPIPERKRVGER